MNQILIKTKKHPDGKLYHKRDLTSGKTYKDEVILRHKGMILRKFKNIFQYHDFLESDNYIIL